VDAERNSRLNEGSRWLPAGRCQGAQVVLVGHAGQAGEHVPHVGQRVDAAALARHDDRVDDRGAVAGVGVTDEQKILLVMRSYSIDRPPTLGGYSAAYAYESKDCCARRAKSKPEPHRDCRLQGSSWTVETGWGCSAYRDCRREPG